MANKKAQQVEENVKTQVQDVSATLIYDAAYEEYNTDATIDQLLNPANTDFRKVRILDENGEVVRPDLMPELSDEELVQFMEKMVRGREWHNRSNIFARQGRLGFYAPTYGQEASTLGTASVLTEDDVLMPAYRDFLQLMEKGMPSYKAFLWSKGHVIGNEGLHENNMWFPQIIIGAQYIQTAGVGLGLKMNGKDAIVMTYTGDGGTSQGDFYEGINYASAYQAPVVFVVQNNGWAISTAREEQTAAQTLAQKASAVGIPGIQVDGMDILAVYAVAKKAREYALAGNGPVLIETITYRFGPHSLSGDDPTRYQAEGIQDYWRSKDPLIRFRKYLTDKGLWSEEKEEEIIEKTKEEAKEAMKVADSQPKQKVSDFLKTTFETPDQILQEQIEFFESKGE